MGAGLSAAELRAGRLGLGMTQRQLAAELGVTPTTLARWERGERAISNPVLVRLALDHLGDRAAAARRPVPLPAPATELIGRDRELASLAALLADPAVRLVTLTGAGGAGKTVLALAALRQGGEPARRRGLPGRAGRPSRRGTGPGGSPRPSRRRSACASPAPSRWRGR